MTRECPHCEVRLTDDRTAFLKRSNSQKTELRVCDVCTSKALWFRDMLVSYHTPDGDYIKECSLDLEAES